MRTMRLERYLSILKAYGVTVSPSGTVGFLYNLTGSAQIWTLDNPGEWPRQRTFENGLVTFASYSPIRDEIVFGRDVDGSGQTQLYLLQENNRITQITDQHTARHRWGGWSPDGEQFAIASNCRDPSSFDVYIQDRGESFSNAECIAETNGWITIAGWSPDGERLLLVQSHSNFDSDIYVLELSSGDIEHLTTQDGEARFRSPVWGPDGNSIYLVTDKGSDNLYLGRINLVTGNVEVVTKDDEWNIDGVAIDQERETIIYSRNIDGYTDLVVGELANPLSIEPYPSPQLPEAVAGGVCFGPDGDWFAITVTNRNLPYNVFTVDVKTGAVEQWTMNGTAGIPKSELTRPQLIRYKSFDDREIPAWYSVPENTRDQRKPVIIDIHGGPEQQRRPSFHGVGQYMLHKGYITFEPNIRGSTGYGRYFAHLDDKENRWDAVKDLKQGIEWLKSRDEVNPSRIIASGTSYGGLMVLLLMIRYPGLLSSGICSCGIADVVSFLENTAAWRRSLREKEYGSLTDDRDFLRSISPNDRIESIEDPLMVIHGANDPLVPVEDVERLIDELQDRDTETEKVIFDGEGHSIATKENEIIAFSKMMEFIEATT